MNAVGDALIVARRNLARIRAQPEMLTGFTIQPVMFVLLFVYVFGGAIQTPGFKYVDFLMPGIITQNIAFGATVTGVGLSDDLSKGIVDRFRSLPIARSAVLAGRTLADSLLNLGAILVMIGVGFIVGFRFANGVFEVVGGLALLLAFGFAIQWIFAVIALTVRGTESVNSVGFLVIFPLTFASSAFVPTDSMPGWLAAFADVNPVTLTVDAVRSLFVGDPDGTAIGGSLAWSLGLLAVFAPIAVWRYRSLTRR